LLLIVASSVKDLRMLTSDLKLSKP
jgi:hypothetical protein